MGGANKFQPQGYQALGDQESPLWSDEDYSTKRPDNHHLELQGTHPGLTPMAPIIEEDSGIISDSMSTFSTNSRNFQMPEKEFPYEYPKQPEHLNPEEEGCQMLNVSLNETNII